jgi:hypothetical protein
VPIRVRHCKSAHILLKILPVKIILLLLSLVITAAAQEDKPSDYKVNCSELKIPSIGCASYNDMLASGDEDLFRFVHNHDVYACFVPAQDMFIMLALRTPPASAFHKTNYGGSEAAGSVWLAKYKNGLEDDSQMSPGAWRKYNESEPIFSSLPGALKSSSSSESEVSFSYDFSNVGGGKTRYVFRMRKSTLRFSETFQWTVLPKDPKKTPERGADDDEGYCVFITD